MFYAIITILILLIFLGWLFSLFLPIITKLIINGVLLWPVVIRGYVELFKEKRFKEYAYGFLLGLIVFLFFFRKIYYFSSKIYIWWITLFLLLVFLISQLFSFLENKKEGSN